MNVGVIDMRPVKTKPVKTNLLNHALLTANIPNSTQYCISDDCDYVRIYNKPESEIFGDVDSILRQHERKLVLFDAVIEKHNNDSMTITVAYSVPLLGFVRYYDDEYYLAKQLYAVIRGKISIPIMVTINNGKAEFYISGDPIVQRCVMLEFPNGDRYAHNNFSDDGCYKMCLGTIRRRWTNLAALLKTVLLATALPTDHVFDTTGTGKIIRNGCIPDEYFVRLGRLDFSVNERKYDRYTADNVAEEIYYCIRDYDDEDDDY